jgi:hypothetical protein
VDELNGSVANVAWAIRMPSTVQGNLDAGFRASTASGSNGFVSTAHGTKVQLPTRGD